MTDWIVLHDQIGRRRVCAIGAVCGDAPVIAIGVSDDDDDEREQPRARARKAGLRALRKFAAKAVPIVTAAVPGGAAAREAAKALLESRRAAAEVETHATHSQAVTGLLSPLAARAIGDVEPPPRVRALLERLNTIVRLELWPIYQRAIDARRRRMPLAERERMVEREALAMQPILTRFERLEYEISDLGWSIVLVDDQNPLRSLYTVEPSR